MIQTAADICLAILILSILLCAWRLVRGPSLPDRLVATETVITNLIAMIAIYCIRSSSSAFFDSVLVLSVLGFVGAVAIAKFLSRGDQVFDD